MTKVTSWKNNLTEMNKVLQPINEMKIGAHGGRYVEIKGKEYSLNSLYKMIEHRCVSKDFNDAEKVAGRAILDKLTKLDEAGTTALKSASSSQKRWTNFKRWADKVFHPFFSRKATHAKIEKKIKEQSSATSRVKEQISTRTSASKEQIPAPDEAIVAEPKPSEKKVDFEHITLDEFKKICPTREAFNELNVFDKKKLNAEIVLYALNNGLYNVRQHSKPTDDQIALLDVSKIDFAKIAGQRIDGQREVFKELFHPRFGDIKKPLHSLSVEKLVYLFPYFDSETQLYFSQYDSPDLKRLIQEVDFSSEKFKGTSFLFFLLKNKTSLKDFKNELLTSSQAKYLFENGQVVMQLLALFNDEHLKDIDLSIMNDGPIKNHVIEAQRRLKEFEGRSKASDLP